MYGWGMDIWIRNGEYIIYLHDMKYMQAHPGKSIRWMFVIFIITYLFLPLSYYVVI